MINTGYTLSINFNYDSDTHTIIETRCIKKEIEKDSARKLYLKAGLKEYSADSSPEIYKDLQGTRMLILEKKLTAEQIRLAMNKSFNLFKDIDAIITDKDSKDMVNKLNISSAL